MEQYKFTEKIPKYGDVFKIDEWRECVEDGGFIDDDGCGNFAKDGLMTDSWGDDVCSLSSIDEAKEMGVTHVVWFNK